jgi:HK97 family phage portal protein
LRSPNPAAMKNRGGNPVRWLDSLRSAFEKKATQLTYDQIANLIDGGASRMVAGVDVSARTALQVSTVLACVKVIADGCATPPLHIYRETGSTRREKAINIPEYRMLHRRPNEWQTSYEWRRMMTMHAALTGTGISLKSRGLNGRVRELIPIMPGRWDVRRTERYEARYRLWDDFGLIGEFGPQDVFVIQGVQWDWLNAMDAVALARKSIGLAIATEQSHAAFHANGVRPSGIYSVDGTLTADQHQRLMDVLGARAGSANAGKPLVMDRNAKFQSTTMTGMDAQHLETRRLQVEEICRNYGVFPIMIGHSDKAATFASSEAFFAAHLKHTLRPWHEAWCNRIDEFLLDGSGPLWAEFDTRYMQAGSMVDRAQWARTMAELGIYTRNELRDEEGKDPLPGLDEPLTPMNMGGAQPEPDDTDGAGSAPN